MEYVYAALILHKLSKEVNEENVSKVISAAGVEPNPVKVKALIAALGEINIDEALKTATMVAPAASTAPEEKKEEKKEVKQEEKEVKQEEAVEGLASLFG